MLSEAVICLNQPDRRSSADRIHCVGCGKELVCSYTDSKGIGRIGNRYRRPVKGGGHVKASRIKGVARGGTLADNGWSAHAAGESDGVGWNKIGRQRHIGGEKGESEDWRSGNNQM